ncbi:P-loop containing nucleoside triphosphate hydrolase protein [Chytridium lagenaria]|nr:P-loop containing nucleoside triphosphate hydrolase protein [Chytridium lagenaria]
MNPFDVLGAGIRFDKKRFGRDLNIFEAEDAQRASKKKAVDAALSSELIAPEVDFFGSLSKKEEGALKKKADASAKKIKSRPAEDGEDDGEERSGARKKRKTEGTKVEEELEEYEDEFENEEEVAVFRKKHRIGVQGTDVPPPSKTFRDLSKRFRFKPFLRKNLEGLGHTIPTAIQMQSTPVLIHGREIMAIAPTGSGKTLAFVLPILHDLGAPSKDGIRALIVSPTRELAMQIERQVKLLIKGKPFRVCVLEKSMVSSNDEAKAPVLKYDIVITTPLRLVHAIQSDFIRLDRVKHLILDEADKLLELGFLEQMDEIFASCSHPKLRKSLFSATMPSGIESLARTFMDDPVRIIIGHANSATDTIVQRIKYVGEESGKLIEIRQMIQAGDLKPPVLIFVQSVDRAKELFHELIYDGINVDVMHADRTKAQRDAAIEAFRLGKTWVLIATDLMARGIDFKGVRLVINYDFPQSVQSYIHRIGRTGRAGRAGEAVTFFTKDDAPHVKLVVNVMKESGCDFPDWMLSIKNTDKNTKKNLKQRAIQRKTISTMSDYDKKKISKKKNMINISKEKKMKED